MKPAAPKLPYVLDEAVDWQACQRDGRVRGAYLKGLDLSDADLEEMTFEDVYKRQACGSIDCLRRVRPSACALHLPVHF